MNVLSTCKFLAAVASVVLPASSVFAAATASDNAGNYAGSYDGLNFGSGFGPYSTAGGSGNSGTFLGSSNGNGGTNGINTAGKSFGLYSSNGAFSRADRFFTIGGANNSNILGLGQTFSLKLDNGSINNGANIGFNLVNSTGVTRLNLNFAGGGSNYIYTSSVTTSPGGNTGVAYTNDGLAITFTQGTANTYTLAVTPTGGATTTLGGTLTASDIAGFQVYNSNAGSGGSYDLFFNSPAVSNVAAVPEPFTSAATGLLIGGAAFKLARRRRKI